MKTIAKLTGAAVVVGSLTGVLINSITASGTAREGHCHTGGNRRPANTHRYPV
jgi:hypothetical protein